MQCLRSDGILVCQLQRVVCEEIDQESTTQEFQQRWKRGEGSYCDPDMPQKIQHNFCTTIKDEAMQRVQVFVDKPPKYFTESANLGKAINEALDLPMLARYVPCDPLPTPVSTVDC